MDYQMEELLPIVSELAQKYAGYESTSVTYEKAQSLMEAVLFCLNEYHDSYAHGLAQKLIKILVPHQDHIFSVYGSAAMYHVRWFL